MHADKFWRQMTCYILLPLYSLSLNLTTSASLNQVPTLQLKINGYQIHHLYLPTLTFKISVIPLSKENIKIYHEKIKKNEKSLIVWFARTLFKKVLFLSVQFKDNVAFEYKVKCLIYKQIICLSLTFHDCNWITNISCNLP